MAVTVTGLDELTSVMSRCFAFCWRLSQCSLQLN